MQNSTQLVMQLHAVRLLAAPGVAAQQIAPLTGSNSSSAPALPKGQQQALLPQQVLPTNSHPPQHDQQWSSSSSGKAYPHNQPPLAPAGSASLSSSDTQLLHDIDTFAGSSSTPDVAGAASSVQHKQPQRQQLNYDQSQQQQGIFPFLGGPEEQQQAAVPLPAGCSHNSLWQVDHQLAGAAAGSSGSSTGAGPPPPPAPPAAGGASGPNSTGSAAGGGAGVSSSSSSSSTLGRLELHWSTCDGRTGRLLTQPLTGPVPASGKEVLMQLHQVVPGQPAAHAGASGPAAAGFSVLVPQQLTARLTLNQPFTATFTLTAGPHDIGPLLVLYTTTAPPPPASSSTAGGNGLASSSSAQLATDSSSIQSRRLGGGGGTADAASDSSCPEVVVQGSRSRRIPALAAGQSVDVPFELLPLRCGWLRLPTFVVASEADGRLLDGVHDVNILVV